MVDAPPTHRPSRTLSMTMRKAVADAHHGPCRTLSATMDGAVADAPPSYYGPSRVQSTALGSKLLGSTVLGSAAAHAPPGTHESGRTLSATLVSAVVDPPNSSNSSSPSPSLSESTALGSGSAGTYVPPSIHNPSQPLTTLG